MGSVLNKDGDQDRDLLIQWLQDLAWPRPHLCAHRPQDVQVRLRQVPRLPSDEAPQPYHQVDRTLPSHNKKGISADEAKKRRKVAKSTTVRRDIAGLDPALLAKAKAARPAKKSGAVAAAKKDLAGRKGAKK